MVIFIAIFEQAWQVPKNWCAKYTKIPYFEKEMKYLYFISGHLASTKTV
jgi:hypothetical protein